MRTPLRLLVLCLTAATLSGCLAAAAVGAAGAVAGAAIKTTGAVVGAGVDVVTPGDDEDSDED